MKKEKEFDINRFTAQAGEMEKSKIVGKKAKTAQNEIKKALAGKSAKKKK